MSHSYTRTELKNYFFEALEMFNDCLDSDISEENVVLDFLTPSTGEEVYERICTQHFPKMLEEDYTEEGYVLYWRQNYHVLWRTIHSNRPPCLLVSVKRT